MGYAESFMRYPTAATTRIVTAGRFERRPTTPRLKPGQVIESPETQLRYRSDRQIGEGGYGQV